MSKNNKITKTKHMKLLQEKHKMGFHPRENGPAITHQLPASKVFILPKQDDRTTITLPSII